jgi:Flp pilus assembly protein TadG
MGGIASINGGTHKPFLLTNKKGQAVVELVLVLPLLLLLIVGAIEYGRLISAKIVITNASRESAYYISMHSTDQSGASTAATNEANQSGVTLSSVAFTNCCTVGNPVTVTVQTIVKNVYLIRLTGGLFGIKGQNNSITLSSSTIMVVQQ